jgi:hypothetical protein
MRASMQRLFSRGNHIHPLTQLLANPLHVMAFDWRQLWHKLLLTKQPSHRVELSPEGWKLLGGVILKRAVDSAQCKACGPHISRMGLFVVLPQAY